MERDIDTRTISKRKSRIWNACPKTFVAACIISPPMRESRSEFVNGCRRSSNDARRLRSLRRRRRRIVISPPRKSEKNYKSSHGQYPNDQNAPFRARRSAAEDRIALRMCRKEVMLHHKSAVG